MLFLHITKVQYRTEKFYFRRRFFFFVHIDSGTKDVFVESGVVSLLLIDSNNELQNLGRLFITSSNISSVAIVSLIRDF